MKTVDSTHHLRARTRRVRPLALVAACAIGLVALGATGDGIADGIPGALYWDTELTSMDLNVPDALVPLGPGWAPMHTSIHIGESVAQPSLGKATAWPSYGDYNPNDVGPNVDPKNVYQVQSFFDVWFDITVTDIDPMVDFPGQPDKASLTFAGNGPASMGSTYWKEADPAIPVTMGLLPPPEFRPYIGHFKVQIPLGGDLNGNGSPDEIIFTLATHTVNGVTHTGTSSDGTTIEDVLRTTLDLSGDIRDAQADPPFSLTLTGPTTGTAKLVPEPGAYALVAGLGLLALAGGRRFRR